jgi:hypothetical protein
MAVMMLKYSSEAVSGFIFVTDDFNMEKLIGCTL